MATSTLYQPIIEFGCHAVSAPLHHSLDKHECTIDLKTMSQQSSDLGVLRAENLDIQV